MKRLIILSSLITLLFLGACGQENENVSGTSDREGVKELTMWSMETRNRDTIIESVDQFNEENDRLKIDVEFFEDEALKTKMKVAIAGNQMPDIFAYWSGETFDTLVDTDLIGDITEPLNADPDFMDNFLPGGFDTFTYDDRIYGIPVLFSAVSLWYNEEIFEEHNLTPPETYDELLEVIDELNAKDIIPITVSGKERWPLLHWYAYLVERLGGTEPFEKAKNGEASFSDPVFVEAAEMLMELAERGFVNGFQGLDYAAAESLFVNEQAAMYLQGEWVMNAFLEDEVADKINFVPFPVIEGGKGDVHSFHGGFGVGMAISAKADQEAAFEAIRFLASPDQRAPIYEGADISPMIEVDLNEENMHPLAYAYDTYIGENLTNYFGYYDQELDAQRAEKFLNFVDSLVSQNSIDIQKELEAINE